MGASNVKLDAASHEGGSAKPTIVIVGSSFSGQKLAMRLQELDPKGDKYDIQFIDKSEHFEFICQVWENFGDDVWDKSATKYVTAIDNLFGKNATFK